MAIGGEVSAVQNPMIRYATEAGWTYVSRDNALRMRRGLGSGLFWDVFLRQLQRLNPGVVDSAQAEQVARTIEQIAPTKLGNREVWEYWLGLKSVYVDSERRERNIRFWDEENLASNTFHVTDEYRFHDGYRSAIRCDVVFLVNGVPLLIVETKSAKTEDGIGQALNQVERYHEDQPRLMALAQVYTLTNLSQYYYAPTWSLQRKSLMNWRDEQAGDYETLIKLFVHPHRLVRIVTKFTHFLQKDGELIKMILRPHQMRATERIVERAQDRTRRRALIWHTQGSGKTLTMLTVARELLQDARFQNPTILVLIDRNELESQMGGVLESAGVQNVTQVLSKAHLRDLLAADTRGILLSMIHKFDDMPANLMVRENVFVLVDEAHRTTGGDLGNYLMGALPNATYIGFTGTPIDKTAHGKGTFKVFGTDDRKGYLDKYSIAESIDDGTTVPLNYEIAGNDLLVDRATLDREFLALADAEGLSDPGELDRILRRAVTLTNELKNPERIRKVAGFVARHFLDTVDPMGYKAFLVAVDREACLLYKEALDAHLPEEWSAVVMTKAHNDRGRLAEYKLSEEDEERLRKDFRKADIHPKILIVTEKLLTGYDAPILYAMYLDKPMRDHVLLQTIARVNRPYEDSAGRRKTAGLIVDFVGIFDRLERALAFDSKDVEGTVVGIAVLERNFAGQMSNFRSEYLPIGQHLRGDKQAEAILEYFRDEPRRAEFYRFFRDVEATYEILSPSPFLRPYLEDYQALADMYRIVREAYNRGFQVERSLLRKTAALVQQHTHTESVDAPERTYRITGTTLRALLEDEQPETVKIFNLVKAVYNLVQAQGTTEPYLIPIGERAEQIAHQFADRLLTAQEAMAQLTELVSEQEQAAAERATSDVSPEAFAVAWLWVRQYGVPNLEGVSDAIQRELADAPHWRTDATQRRSLRQALYVVLMDAGADEDIQARVDAAFRLLGVG